jgi:hypothetical protein
MSEGQFAPLEGCLCHLGTVIRVEHSFLKRYFEPLILSIFSFWATWNVVCLLIQAWEGSVGGLGSISATAASHGEEVGVSRDIACSIVSMRSTSKYLTWSPRSNKIVCHHLVYHSIPLPVAGRANGPVSVILRLVADNNSATDLNPPLDHYELNDH